MSITYQIVEFANNAVFVGSNNNSYRMYSMGMFNYLYDDFCTSNYAFTKSSDVFMATDHFITVEKKENKTFVGGETIIEDTELATFTLQDCWLFYASGTHGGIYANPAPVRIAAFSLKDESDNLLCDLIPVRVGNVGYMYDKVSGKFFTNQGTGNFVLGPDL